MVSLALDSAHLAETYDRVSDRQFNHGKLLIEDLAIARGESVLDVGCGTGRLGAYVADRVGSSGIVRGIDPLPLRVELANKKGKANLAASVGRAEDLSAFARDSFDVVFYNSVLHWLPEKLPALREARRVLKRGGRIGISTAAKEQPHDFEGVLKAVFSAPGLADITGVPSGTPHKVSSGELFAALATAGFVSIEHEIRTFTDHFASADDVVSFNLASSFGNFLSHLNEPQRKTAKELIASELERFRTPSGIRLERRLIFAVARADG